MASSYMLADRIKGYEVKVSETKRGRKIVERKLFTNYEEAQRFFSMMEDRYWHNHEIEFNTIFRGMM